MTTRTLALGPTTAQLTLHTGRAGVAAAVGHDLVLGVGVWNGTVTVDGSTLTSVVVHAETSSLSVLEGHGGAKPLNDKDRAKIVSEAAGTLKGATVDLAVSTPVEAVPSGTLSGEVTLAGRTNTFTMQFETHEVDGGTEVRARGEIVQTSYGIKPYSAMLGALKLRDMVEVRFEATFPAA